MARKRGTKTVKATAGGTKEVRTGEQLQTGEGLVRPRTLTSTVEPVGLLVMSTGPGSFREYQVWKASAFSGQLPVPKGHSYPAPVADARRQDLLKLAASDAGKVFLCLRASSERTGTVQPKVDRTAVPFAEVSIRYHGADAGGAILWREASGTSRQLWTWKVGGYRESLPADVEVEWGSPSHEIGRAHV